MMEAVLEEVLEGAAGEEKVEMGTVGMTESVTVVGEDVQAMPLGKPGVGGALRVADQAHHGVPGGDVIPGAQRLGLRRLEMVEVDVDATAVAAEILPTPVLRVVALGAAERLIAAGIRRVDLAQQGSRRLAGGAVGTIGAENEVGKFDIGAAELGKTIGVPGHRSPLQAART